MIKEPLIFVRNLLRISSLSMLVLMLNSCADSEVAKKLANSFDSPLVNQNVKTLEDPVNEIKVPEEKVLANKSLIQSNLPITDQRRHSAKETYEKVIPMKNFESKKNLASFNPQPYRIILRLSGANPSAPAEKVTRALREAGVVFEVEKIERFEKRSLPKLGRRESD